MNMKLKDYIFELDNMQPKEQILSMPRLLSLVKNASTIELRNSLIIVKSPYLKNILLSYLERKTKNINHTYSDTNHNAELEVDLEAIKSDAFSESLGQILHELEPIVGSLYLHARQEIPEFNKSEVYNDLRLLEETIETFEQWRVVERSANYQLHTISDLIEKEAGPKRNSTGINITNNVSSSLIVKTDKSLFRIIISNILRNAIQATSADNYQSSPIIINGGVTDKVAWVSVIDSGSGLEATPEILVKSRFTTKPGNKGLGLAIVNKAINALEGTWQIKNNVTRGAEFYFEFPIRD